jgi:hypothetical protein
MEADTFIPIAVEGTVATGEEGTPPVAWADEPDPLWQPV